jgi:alkylhydroperoxidase/carboxymuconolactone decarboxylase family protein YurZ
LQHHLKKGIVMKKDALYKKGMKTRREVLGAGREAAIVREEDEFSMPLRIFTTRYVWGEFWSGKGSSRKTRSLINVALLTALKCREELRTHIRAARNSGCTKAEIRDVLLQCAVYAGVPVMRDAVRVAQDVFREEGKPSRR